MYSTCSKHFVSLNHSTDLAIVHVIPNQEIKPPLIRVRQTPVPSFHVWNLMIRPYSGPRRHFQEALLIAPPTPTQHLQGLRLLLSSNLGQRLAILRL